MWFYIYMKCIETVKNYQGFTIIEFVAVLIMISIITAVAMVKSGKIIDNSQGESSASVIKSHLRYAQIKAIENINTWGVRFTGSSYSLFEKDGANLTDHTFPGEDSKSVSLPDGVSITQDVSFDDWGRPYPNQDCSGSSAGVSFSVNGQTITVNQETGYVP